MSLQALPGTLCLLRVYALYSRSPRVLALLILIGLGTIINAASMLATSHRLGGTTLGVISIIPGCNQFTPDIGGRYAALAWMGVPVFDSVIFSLTLYKAFTIGRGIRLLEVIVRDGTMYFSALFIANLGNILMLRFSPPLLKTSTSALTNVLSTILISRLVLNLRERNSTLTGLSTTVETERRFRTALPAAGPITSLRTVI
ncbi:hypothetical protein BJV78DRAFT_177528 [Lactifluus subvellereus]|nr:hypothetical protein BJV78DRAFT_177528 [Lactifluus subvellereus]